MGNTCKPLAVSFQCMTKSTTNKKINKKKKKKKIIQRSIHPALMPVTLLVKLKKGKNPPFPWEDRARMKIKEEDPQTPLFPSNIPPLHLHAP